MTETHISVLFLVGERVVKIRKPVRFGFLDFTDRAVRAADCRREVALNRRLAPDVYLGTGELRMEGEVLEHAVVMRRLPARRNLARLATEGAELGAEIDRIAEVLAEFHVGAARSEEISRAATADALAARWRADAREVRRFVGRLLEADRHRRVRELAARYLAGRAALFEARIAAGQVCDGHGDLQAADIFCCDDGPRLLDCLQFDDRLRYGDGLADVAFLAMDLERLGRPELARRLLDAYRARNSAPFPPSLAHFYVASRAHVRMLVACLRAEQSPVETGAEEAAAEARLLLELAERHLAEHRIRLVLVGGLPGVGKSTVAAELAQQLDAEVLSTDRARRLAPEGRGEDRYSAPARAAVYEAVLHRAGELLSRGHTVVLDASWAEASLRHRAEEVAQATSSDLVELHCQCPAAMARERIAARVATGTSESEATAEVASAMARRFDPWPDATLVDTSATVADAVRQAADAVRHAS